MRILLTIISWLLHIFEFLLAIRIILQFFTVTSSAPIISWLYSITDSIIGIFGNIFPNPNYIGKFLIDWPAIITLIIISLIDWLIISLLPRTFSRGY